MEEKDLFPEVSGFQLPKEAQAVLRSQNVNLTQYQKEINDDIAAGGDRKNRRIQHTYGVLDKVMGGTYYSELMEASLPATQREVADSFGNTTGKQNFLGQFWNSSVPALIEGVGKLGAAIPAIFEADDKDWNARNKSVENWVRPMLTYIDDSFANATPISWDKDKGEVDFSNLTSGAAWANTTASLLGFMAPVFATAGLGALVRGGAVAGKAAAGLNALSDVAELAAGGAKFDKVGRATLGVEFVSSTAMMFPEYQKMGIDNGLTIGEATKVALPLAIVNGAIELIGGKALAKGLGFTTADAGKVIREVIRQNADNVLAGLRTGAKLDEKAFQDIVEAVAKNTVHSLADKSQYPLWKRMAAHVGKASVDQGLPEAGEELLQTTSESLSQVIYNSTIDPSIPEGRGRFANFSAGEYATNAIFGTFLGKLMGTSMGLLHKNPKAFDQTLFNYVASDVNSQLANGAADLQSILPNLKAYGIAQKGMDDGHYDDAEREKINAKIGKMAEVAFEFAQSPEIGKSERFAMFRLSQTQNELLDSEANIAGARQAVTELQQQIQSGQLSPKALIDANKALNEAEGQLGAYDPATQTYQAETSLQVKKSAVSNVLQQVGKSMADPANRPVATRFLKNELSVINQEPAADRDFAEDNGTVVIRQAGDGVSRLSRAQIVPVAPSALSDDLEFTQDAYTPQVRAQIEPIPFFQTVDEYGAAEAIYTGKQKKPAADLNTLTISPVADAADVLSLGKDMVAAQNQPTQVETPIEETLQPLYDYYRQIQDYDADGKFGIAKYDTFEKFAEALGVVSEASATEATEIGIDPQELTPQTQPDSLAKLTKSELASQAASTNGEYDEDLVNELIQAFMATNGIKPEFEFPDWVDVALRKIGWWDLIEHKSGIFSVSHSAANELLKYLSKFRNQWINAKRQVKRDYTVEQINEMLERISKHISDTETYINEYEKQQANGFAGGNQTSQTPSDTTPGTSNSEPGTPNAESTQTDDLNGNAQTDPPTDTPAGTGASSIQSEFTQEQKRSAAVEAIASYVELAQQSAAELEQHTQSLIGGGDVGTRLDAAESALRATTQAIQRITEGLDAVEQVAGQQPGNENSGAGESGKAAWEAGSKAVRRKLEKLRRTPYSFREGILWYFADGGRVRREDLVRFVGEGTLRSLSGGNSYLSYVADDALPYDQVVSSVVVDRMGYDFVEDYGDEVALTNELFDTLLSFSALSPQRQLLRLLSQEEQMASQPFTTQEEADEMALYQWAGEALLEKLSNEDKEAFSAFLQTLPDDIDLTNPEVMFEALLDYQRNGFPPMSAEAMEFLRIATYDFVFDGKFPPIFQQVFQPLIDQYNQTKAPGENANENVSDAEYEDFIDTGRATELRLQSISNKIVQGISLSLREIAILQTLGQEVETLIQKYNESVQQNDSRAKITGNESAGLSTGTLESAANPSEPTRTTSNGSRKTARRADLDQRAAQLRQSLAEDWEAFVSPSDSLNASLIGISPKQFEAATRMIGNLAELGINRFEDAMLEIIDIIGSDKAAAGFRAFKAAYMAVKANDEDTDEDLNALRKTTFEQINQLQNVSSTALPLESDSPRGTSGYGVGPENVYSNERGVLAPTGNGGTVDGGQGNIFDSNSSLPGDVTVAVGSEGDPDLYPQERNDVVAERNARHREYQGSSGFDESGPYNESGAEQSTLSTASGKNKPREKLQQQRDAESIAVAGSELENIQATLPYLLPHQHTNVQKAEVRLLEQNEKGILFTDGTGTGKAQPMWAKVLTVDGWKKMGAISKGDKVISVDGTPTSVLGVFDRGVKSVYKVTFSDGSATHCCDEHLWETQTLYERRKSSGNPKWDCGKPKVRELKEIAQTIDKSHFIPIASAINFKEKDFYIHPYIIGVILGDGCVSYKTTEFSNFHTDTHIEHKVRELLPSGYILKREINKDRCDSCKITEINPTHNGKYKFNLELERVGVRFKKSYEKSIPEEYLFGSAEQRVSLLQGLMDTDGWVDKRIKSAIYGTTSESLSKSIVALVNSLGGVALTTQKTPKYSYRGEKRTGRLFYILHINLPKDIEPFSLPRKADIYVPNYKYLPKRKIVSIDFVSNEPVRCIEVEHERSLYITDDYIVTHNTLTSLGIAKRFIKRGKKNILIITPSDKKIGDWIDEARLLGIDAKGLQGLKDRGEGISVTTYANFGQNEEIAKRTFDLIIYDESQNLISNESGNSTLAYNKHRDLAKPALDAYYAARREYGEALDEARQNRNTANENRAKAKFPFIKEEFDRWDAEHDKWVKVVEDIEDNKIPKRTEQLINQTKVVFLSATPFAYHKNIRYVDGFLFKAYQQLDSNFKPLGDSGGGYNSGDAMDKYMMAAFGYRMRYNKLTEPEAGVDQGLMERNWLESLKASGAVSATKLDIPQDYSREFVLLSEEGQGTPIGLMIDEGLRIIHDNKEFEFLSRAVNKRMDYLYKNRLLEQIKAKLGIERIRKHLEENRKVVVFHTYNEGITSHPFDFSYLGDADFFEKMGDEAKIAAQEARLFHQKYPQYKKIDLRGLTNVPQAIQNAFGDEVVLFNGAISKTKRAENIKKFNDDNSTVSVIVVNIAAGEAGLNLHDTTGGSQRVLIQLGLPVRPTSAIQSEGRIYRTGQLTNAIFEYFVTHFNFEKYAFGSKINERSGTAENLAMGNEARDLKISFKEGYLNPIDTDPSAEQGVGGKQNDYTRGSMTLMQKAMTYYWARQKKTAKTKSREGVDYFATPEPLGLKKVQWLHLRPGDSVLEPSAGHGAIARWFPDSTSNTMIEPSTELRSDLSVNAHGTVVGGTFEQLSIINKYRGIAMNPPFGTAGKMALEHLAKAIRHLENEGRIVATVPTGSFDAKFEKYFYGKNEKGRYENPEAEAMSLTARILLPSVTFERAGTAVNAQILILDKQVIPTERQKMPQTRTIDLRSITNINDLFERLDELDIAPVVDRRTEQQKKETSPVVTSQPQPSDKPDAVKNPVQGKHTKNGNDIFIVQTSGRLSDDEYARIRGISKNHGGYYSSYKDNKGAIPGFIFNTANEANAFYKEITGKEAAAPTPVQMMFGPQPFQPFFIGASAAQTLGGELLERYEQARQMVVEGKSRRAVLRGTDWLLGLDNKLRYWVDNAASKVLVSIPSDVRKLPRSYQNARAVTTLEQAFDFAPLYEAYPDLKNVGFGFYYDPINKDTAGVAEDKPNGDKHIFINLATQQNKNPDELAKTIKEEVQHQIQLLEGFGYGNSFAQIRESIYRGVLAISDNNGPVRPQGLAPGVIDYYANAAYQAMHGEMEADVAAENSGVSGLREKISRRGLVLVHFGNLEQSQFFNKEGIANFLTDTQSQNLPSGFIGKQTTPANQSADAVSSFENTLQLLSQRFEGKIGFQTPATEAEFATKQKELAPESIQTAYGFFDPVTRQVWLNPAVPNANTPIHEIAHPWVSWAKSSRSDLYNRGMELVRDSLYMRELLSDPNYRNLTIEQLNEEALVRAIADQGEKFITPIRKRGFLEWFNELFASIKEFLGLRDVDADTLATMSLEEFSQRAAADILAGSTDWASSPPLDLGRLGDEAVMKPLFAFGKPTFDFNATNTPNVTQYANWQQHINYALAQLSPSTLQTPKGSGLRKIRKK